MAIKPVLKMGNPELLKVSEEVSHFSSAELDELITDLRDTMQALNGAGIAAPQIGVLKRVVIFGVSKNARYPQAEDVPETILINPDIKTLTEDTDGMWEGCLSVPGMRGYVNRPNKIRYSGYTPEGQMIERVAEGFHATVVQHECDHLDGILYPMRIEDMRLFGFETEINRER